MNRREQIRSVIYKTIEILDSYAWDSVYPIIDLHINNSINYDREGRIININIIIKSCFSDITENC